MFDFTNIDPNLPLVRNQEDDLVSLIGNMKISSEDIEDVEDAVDAEDPLDPDVPMRINIEIPDYVQRMTHEEKVAYYQAVADPSQLICVYCQSLGRTHIGHTRDTCTVLKETRCNYCACYGHTGKYCPTGRRSPLTITCMRCFRLGKDEKEFMGHTANECGAVNANTQSVNANHPVIRKYVDEVQTQLQSQVKAQIQALTAELEQYKQYCVYQQQMIAYMQTQNPQTQQPTQQQPIQQQPTQQQQQPYHKPQFHSHKHPHHHRGNSTNSHTATQEQPAKPPRNHQPRESSTTLPQIRTGRRL